MMSANLPIERSSLLCTTEILHGTATNFTAPPQARARVVGKQMQSAASIADAKKDGDSHLQHLEKAGVLGLAETRDMIFKASLEKPATGNSKKVHLIRHGQVSSLPVGGCAIKMVALRFVIV